MDKPKFRYRFNTVRSPQTFTEPTLTKQEFKDECDVNKIVERASRGIVPRFNSLPAQYGDFSDVPSLMDAFDMTARAQEVFETLPSGLRQELGNDPRNVGSITRAQFEKYRLLKSQELSEDVIDPSSKAAPKGSPVGQTGSEPAAGKPSKKAKDDSSE